MDYDYPFLLPFDTINLPKYIQNIVFLIFFSLEFFDLILFRDLSELFNLQTPAGSLSLPEGCNFSELQYPLIESKAEDLQQFAENGGLSHSKLHGKIVSSELWGGSSGSTQILQLISLFRFLTC